MKKPKKHTKESYSYSECRKYLEKKYGYDERNYANTKYDGTPDDAPYQDFWHFVCDFANPNNGSYFTMDNFWLDKKYGAKEEWQRTIIEYYLSEFGEGKNREIEFYVWW